MIGKLLEKLAAHMSRITDTAGLTSNDITEWQRWQAERLEEANARTDRLEARLQVLERQRKRW